MTAAAAALAPRLRRPRPATAVAVALALLVAVAGLGAALAGGEDAGPRTLAGPGFALEHPASWRAATPAELAATPSRPLAVLRRSDRRGVVVVRQGGPLRGSLESLGRGLGRRLERRLPGVRPVGARVVQLATGPALSYTFVRGPVAQSIVVAPIGGRTVTIESVARGDADDVAREIGALVRSLRAR